MHPHRFLHADGAGYAPPPLTPAPKMKSAPAELPLTLSADVLRLPYPPATRLVLAEIISLHEATRGCCDCSDAHLAARLTISEDTVSRAVKQLHQDGLVLKTVDKGAGFYRTLTPVAEAIEAKAATNPYPQIAASYPQNAARGATRKMPLAYPQNAAPPTRILPDPLPAKCGTNTYTSNLPLESSSESSSAAHEAAVGQPGLEELPPPERLSAEELPADGPDASAPHTEGGAPKAKKARPSRPARTSLPEVTFLDSELADYDAFAAAFAGTDYALANLRYYHEKIAAWRQKGEAPRRKDWVATSKQFFLNDISSNCLVLAPSTQFHGAEPGPTDAGARAAGQRRSRYDA